MPMCNFTTSLSCEEIPADFHVQLAEEIGKVLSKPIEVVTVCMHPGTLIFRNGCTSASAVLSIWSVNVFSAEKNPGYVRSLKDFIMDKLSLPEDRIGILFHDLLPEQLGRPVK